jgi:RNA 3'-terminal phosphate cyclase (ATP)
MHPVVIDGAEGEGGGQVLRSALSLSAWTGQPFRMERIRGRRKRPGLLRQHLTAVKATAELCAAETSGAELNSTTLEFRPGRVRPGDYTFRIGSGGSTTLVLQTVLLPLLGADGPSRVTIEGGTHNAHAPPFPFLKDTFLPVLARMGPQVQVTLERPGFQAAGGGRLVAEIAPIQQWKPLELLERGEVIATLANALVSDLPASIAQRELTALRRTLELAPEDCEEEHLTAGYGPGNLLRAQVQSTALTETFSYVGERGLSSEAVAQRVANQVRRYLVSDAPVGEFLADQLLLYMAAGAGGAFRALPLSLHAETHIDILRRFLDVGIQVHREHPTVARVEVVRP